MGRLEPARRTAMKRYWMGLPPLALLAAGTIGAWAVTPEAASA